jgi:hypothetical protein
MADQDQMMADATKNNLSIKQGSKITTQLKHIYKEFTQLLKTEQYGIQEDTLFTVPYKATAKLVSRLSLARSRDINLIHTEIQQLQKRLKDVNKHIHEHQKANCRLALTKQRNRAWEEDENETKKNIKEDRDRNNIKRQKLNEIPINKTYKSLEELLADDPDELDSDDARVTPNKSDSEDLR